MSDGITPRRASSAQKRQRRKGATRGGRHGLKRAPVVVGQDDFDDFLVEEQVVKPPVRPRRAVAARAARSAGISREAEFAYIRSDMHRLFVIAGSLLALMLVLLVVLNR